LKLIFGNDFSHNKPCETSYAISNFRIYIRWVILYYSWNSLKINFNEVFNPYKANCAFACLLFNFFT
jgi:hypothetical protein